MKRLSLENRSRGYTLVEALVAGVVLMIGVSAASSLTLALITQDEMNERTALAINFQECAVRLYQEGLSPAQIQNLIPEVAVVSDLSITTGTENVVHSPAVPGLPAVPLQYADITVTFNPSPATESWSARKWTAGGNADSRTLTVRAYRWNNPVSSP